MSKAIRLALPDLPQVIGGVHCTMVPDDVHQTRLFDFVCVGEGDYALLRLMEALENHDDVQNAYANFDMDESVMEQFEA